MAELPDGHHRHLWWFSHLVIGDGDEVSFALVETTQPTPPAEDRASNSPEYIADQQEYEQMKPEPTVLRRLGRDAAGLIFEVRVNGVPTRASLERAREFITASLNWSNFGSERARFSVHSFSVAEAIGRRSGNDWLSQFVHLGDTLSVKISYHHLRLV
jgi:hypothetical protein